MSSSSYDFIKHINSIVKEREDYKVNNAKLENNANIQDPIKLYLDQQTIKDLIEHLNCVNILKITNIFNILIDYLQNKYLQGNEEEFRKNLGLQSEISDDEEDIYEQVIEINPGKKEKEVIQYDIDECEYEYIECTCVGECTCIKEQDENCEYIECNCTGECTCITEQDENCEYEYIEE
ncbi:MAG: hypothetical protein KIT69_14835 [Propionibacteriaceae bacterium]|nr:hypothetical protein [Propionibacteriaceae bacterium]